MSIYAILGGDDQSEFQFSSNRGLGDLSRWAEKSLEPASYPNLHHLLDWGWVNDIDELVKEIRFAIITSKPPKSVSKTLSLAVTNLERRPSNAVTVMLTDGLSSQEDSGGWEGIR